MAGPQRSVYVEIRFVAVAPRGSKKLRQAQLAERIESARPGLCNWRSKASSQYREILKQLRDPLRAASQATKVAPAPANHV